MAAAGTDAARLVRTAAIADVGPEQDLDDAESDRTDPRVAPAPRAAGPRMASWNGCRYRRQQRIRRRPPARAWRLRCRGGGCGAPSPRAARPHRRRGRQDPSSVPTGPGSRRGPPSRCRGRRRPDTVLRMAAMALRVRWADRPARPPAPPGRPPGGGEHPRSQLAPPLGWPAAPRISRISAIRRPDQLAQHAPPDRAPTARTPPAAAAPGSPRASRRAPVKLEHRSSAVSPDGDGHAQRLSSRSSAPRPAAPIGRGGSSHIEGTQDRGQGQQRCHRGELAGELRRLPACSPPPAPRPGCRRRPQGGADFQHDLGRHHAVPGRPRRARPRPWRPAGPRRPGDQFGQLRPRKAWAARPRLVAPARARPRTAGSARAPASAAAPGAAAPAGRGRAPAAGPPATPVERVDQAHDLQQLLVAGARHVAVERRQHHVGAHALAARISSARARRSITDAPVRQSSCSFTRRPRSKRISWASATAAGGAVVRVQHRQRGQDLLQHLALCGALVADHDSHWPQTCPQPSSSHSGRISTLRRRSPGACGQARSKPAPCPAGRAPRVAPRHLHAPSGRQRRVPAWHPRRRCRPRRPTIATAT